MSPGGQTQAQAPQLSWKRAFRPFFLWLPVALALVAVDLHLRLLRNTRIFFSVTVEGHPIQDGYVAHLNSRPVSPNQRVVPGWRTFRLEMNDAEPVRRSLWIWYGSNHVSGLNLTAHKGALEILAEPPPNDLQVSGRWFSTAYSQTQTFFPAVPVSEYVVTVRYDWTREEKVVRVQRGRTNQLLFRPDLGGLHLATQPAEAEFRLASLSRGDIGMNGAVPVQLRQLPSGKYLLRVWRGDYFKESTVEIRRGETNRLTVAFEYGQVQLVSDPAGATVYQGDQTIGETPKVFTDLKPGRYSFRLERTGYEPAQVNFEVQGKEPLTVRTNLVNIRYKTAMQNARRFAGGSRPQYREALASLNEALEAQPDDAEALNLKTKLETEFQTSEARLAQEQQQAQAKLAEEKRQADLVARKKLAPDRFKAVTGNLKDSALFDTHHWTVQGKLAVVRAAIVRTFDKAAVRWTVQQESALEEDPAVFQCGPKGFLASRRSCVVLASQVTPEEVHVYAKFWDYAAKETITINLIGGSSNDDDNFVPMHPKYYHPEEPAMAEKRRRQLAETFWQTLQNELR